MEVWILLAAAGSGYLAHCWQNAQKTRGASTDKADDDDNTALSSHPLSSRERYCHFSSSGKRQAGRFKGNSNWGWYVSRSSQVVGKASVGCVREHKIADAGDFDDGKNGREDHALHNGAIVDTCSCLSTPKSLEKTPDACILHTAQVNGSSEISTGCPAFNVFWPSQCSGLKFTHENNEDGHVSERAPSGEVLLGKTFTDSQGPILSRSYSGKRTNDSSSDGSVKSGFLFHDRYSGKRMKDAVDNYMVSEEEAFVFGGTWMPGFWDVSKGVFVLDTDSLLVPEVGESRRRGGATKIRTPNKSGRSRGLSCRRASPATRKLMTSLESCLSAQLDEDSGQLVTGGDLPLFPLHSRDACEQPIGACVKHLGNEALKAVDSDNLLGERSASMSKVDFAIGLPSLPRQLSSRTSLSKMGKIKSLVGRATHGETVCNLLEGNSQKLSCKPSRGNARAWENAWRECNKECSTSLGGQSFHMQGIANSSLKGLLFNFGVGVGMMFTIMANIHDVKQLIRLLKEAESLLKDLEGELEGGKNLRFECDYIKDTTAEDVLVEQRCAVRSMLRKVRSTKELLDNVRLSLSDDLAPASATDHMHSKEMAKLEAELEAELERMEMKLNNGDILQHCRRYSSLSELDADVGSLVQGELSMSGLPYEVEPNSEGADGSYSLHENLHFGNCAVSPEELAKRLHEVLEARQEKQILELEAKLKLMGSRLQAKEDELNLWKKRSLGILPGNDCVSLSSSQEREDCVEVTGTTKKEVLSCIQMEKHLFSPTMHHSPDVSSVSAKCNGHSFTSATKHTAYRRSSLHQRVPKPKNSTTFTALGGEALAAYNEVCDEFSTVQSHAATGSPVATSVDGNTEIPHFSENCFFKGAAGKDQDFDFIHQDNPDMLSFVEDISCGDGFGCTIDMQTLVYAPTKTRNSWNKGVVVSHLEPKQVLSSSKSVDLSDDTANDTLGSTPCLMKCMDLQTVAHCYTDDQLKTKAEMEANSSKVLPNPNWSGEVLLHAGANSPSHDRPFVCSAQDIIDVAESHGQYGSALDWSVSEASSCSSDLDEQLGQMLIKRIVEKSRRGSSIIEVAHSVLASFETDETPDQ